MVHSIGPASLYLDTKYQFKSNQLDYKLSLLPDIRPAMGCEGLNIQIQPLKNSPQSLTGSWQVPNRPWIVNSWPFLGECVVASLLSVDLEADFLTNKKTGAMLSCEGSTIS